MWSVLRARLPPVVFLSPSLFASLLSKLSCDLINSQILGEFREGLESLRERLDDSAGIVHHNMDEVKCREHEKAGTYYCASASCMRVFCQGCAYKHCQHDFWVIDDTLMQRIDRKMQDLFSNLSENHLESVKTMKALEELSTDLHKDATNLIEQIRTKFDCAIQKLTQQKMDLLNCVNDRQTQLAEQLNTAIQHCQEIINYQQEARANTDSFLRRFQSREPEAIASATDGVLAKLQRSNGLKDVPSQRMGLEFVWEGDDVDWEFGSLVPAQPDIRERNFIYFFRDYSKIVWKLDRHSHSWSQLTDPSLPMFRSLAVAYNNQDDSYSIFGTSKQGEYMVTLSTPDETFQIDQLSFAFPMWSCAAWLTKSVYLLGGQVGENSLSNCRKYTSGYWTNISDMNFSRDSASAAGYKNHLYIFGGYFNHQLLSSIEKYDPVKDVWLLCRFRMPIALAYTGVVQVPEGLVLLGGEGQNFASCEVYFWDTCGELTTLDKLQQGFTNHLTTTAEVCNRTVFLLETENQLAPTVRVYQLSFTR